MLVCDSHYYADRDEEESGNGESEKETVPGEVDFGIARVFLAVLES